MKTALVTIQAATFLPLACLFVAAGEWRLGVAQACLAVVTIMCYY